MYTVYIDIPPDRYADPVLRDISFTMSFVCNQAAGISRGAVFSVECDSEADAVAFLLTSGFATVSLEKIAAIQEHKYGVELIIPRGLQTQVGHCSNYSFASWPRRTGR